MRVRSFQRLVAAMYMPAMKMGSTRPGAPLPNALSATINHAAMKYSRALRRSPRLIHSRNAPIPPHTSDAIQGWKSRLTGSALRQGSLPGNPQLPPPEPEKKSSRCGRKPWGVASSCSVRLREARYRTCGSTHRATRANTKW